MNDSFASTPKMPGRVTSNDDKTSEDGVCPESTGPVVGAATSATARKRLDKDDVLVESRRQATQCPTPPTDPFPDLEADTDSGVDVQAQRMEPPAPPALASGQVAGPAAGVTTKPRSLSTAKGNNHESVRKLSASQMQALAAAPDSLPTAVLATHDYPLSAGAADDASHPSMADQMLNGLHSSPMEKAESLPNDGVVRSTKAPRRTAADFQRPPPSSRTLSTPPINRKSSSSAVPMTHPANNRRNSFNPLPRPAPLNLSTQNHLPQQASTKPSPAQPPSETPNASPAEPLLPTIPLPPMSLPTHLQLELAGQRPSPLYIHHDPSADEPYESSAVKFERLLNSLLLPPYLEQVMYFGTLACFDAWLYTFTILPMRFVAALGVLIRWWLYLLLKEIKWVVGFVWIGLGRLWERGRRGRSGSRDRADSIQVASEVERSQSRSRGTNSQKVQQNGTNRLRSGSDAGNFSSGDPQPLMSNGAFHPPRHFMPRPAQLRHRRTKSMPSNLTSFNKADLLQGALLICSSMALMNLDASRMYHFIRAQSSMKLYVIYNILEVADRLLGAIGQDILECLFSSETLSRNSSGRSKVLLPFGMFILSLIYNVIHTWCLFYQVITLNVAVNSYSNSLLTLLISNQFVEIKGSVFKKIEKENLFQLTCSDVVERFQTCIILLIIGMRNIVEVGGLSIPQSTFSPDGVFSTGPKRSSSILPASFTVLPAWLQSMEVLSPFIVVIGIEMLVDWIKHAYINKFNNVKPRLYRRMLDILCKDYYTNAFSASSLSRRLGLPVIPLSCLFIRASFQVYHMFLATHVPSPIPTSTTELSVESSTPSSAAMVAAFEHLDTLIRHALGRAVYAHNTPSENPWWSFSSDDAIALLTMVVFFFLAWVVLLIVKLLLGMVLLRYSHRRYSLMKAKEQAIAAGQAEHDKFFTDGRRVGSWGAVEIGDERRRVLYDDDPEGLKSMRDRERKTLAKAQEKSKDDGLAKISRYELSGKRIW
ncbi:DUF747-domain-containing protein [Xylariaceae sp. FL1019]|nr:DUF747-domain-containing protein [Xylariaceae sp. FL1019]